MALKSCPKSNKSPNLVTLSISDTVYRVRCIRSEEPKSLTYLLRCSYVNFKNVPFSRPLFRLFFVFSTSSTNLQQTNVNNNHLETIAGIQTHNLFKHEPLPITSIPGHLWPKILFRYWDSNTQELNSKCLWGGDLDHSAILLLLFSVTRLGEISTT